MITRKLRSPASALSSTAKKKKRRPLGPHFQWEMESGRAWVAGIDEAGRGCLAGPVSIAGVVFAPDLWTKHRQIPELKKINDSKKLSAQAREEILPWIEANALAFSVALVSHTEIDRINILQATFAGARQVVAEIELKLTRELELILMDGKMPIKGLVRPQLPIIEGDAKSITIAAASILAKVTRDRWMTEIHRTHPTYGFAIHKGYGTKMHTSALRQHGPCAIHRQSFLRKFEANEAGRRAEERAAAWLSAQGFKILQTNWKKLGSEIDLIAEQNQVLHFFEVRLRQNLQVGETAALDLDFSGSKRMHFRHAIRKYLSSELQTERQTRAHLLHLQGDEINPHWDVFSW